MNVPSRTIRKRWLFYTVVVIASLNVFMWIRNKPVCENHRPSLVSFKHPMFVKSTYHQRLKGNVTCSKLFAGDLVHTNMSLSASLFANFDAATTWQLYVTLTESCEHFANIRNYILDPMTTEEKSFPIAYSIMAFKNAEQTERLLRAIYRPQNVYCLHFDTKAEYEYKALQTVADCFDNVFMSSRRAYVGWNNFTSLEADLICMEDLLKVKKKWKYLINLTGQEFPLKTNLEIVKILSLLNGANDVEGISKRLNADRRENAGPVPGNLTLYKGSNHVTLCRDAVDFIIHNPLSKQLIEWHKNVSFPGESFFSILNHNPQAGMPGAYKGKITHTDQAPVQPAFGDPNTVFGKPFLSRYKYWFGEAEYKCHGKFVRAICIQGVGDLPMLQKRKELFVNKVYLDYQPATFVCLEELLYNRTWDEYKGDVVFNTSYYERLDYYKHVVV